VPPDDGKDLDRSARHPLATPVRALQRLIERKHRCVAHPTGDVTVWELLGGRIVDEHTVHVFALSGHPAPAAYAWMSNGRCVAMLHAGAICGPAEAVDAVLRSCAVGGGGPS
jgi:hypothetical protein